MEINFPQIEKKFTDYIINIIGPSQELDNSRESKFNKIKHILQKAFIQEKGIKFHIFSFGSFPMRTYLPDSDMDITIILEDIQTKTIISNYSYEYLNK
jgi:DNA polymerase sigma